MQVDCFLNVVNDISLNWLKCKRICKRQRTLYSQKGGPVSPCSELNTRAFRIFEPQIRPKGLNIKIFLGVLDSVMSP